MLSLSFEIVAMYFVCLRVDDPNLLISVDKLISLSFDYLEEKKAGIHLWYRLACYGMCDRFSDYLENDLQATPGPRES